MLKNIGTFLLTLAIPVALFATVWQSSRYSRLESELVRLQDQQSEIVKQNKKIISGISVLSTPERIEKVATQDLKMRKALPDEITRIELKNGELGG